MELRKKADVKEILLLFGKCIHIDFVSNMLSIFDIYIYFFLWVSRRNKANTSVQVFRLFLIVNAHPDIDLHA